MAFITRLMGLAKRTMSWLHTRLTSRAAVSVLTPHARKRKAGSIESNRSETVDSDVDSDVDTVLSPKRCRTSRTGHEVRGISPKENAENRSSANEGLSFELYVDTPGGTNPHYSTGIPDDFPKDKENVPSAADAFKAVPGEKKTSNSQRSTVIPDETSEENKDENPEEQDKENFCPAPDICNATLAPRLSNAVDERRVALGDVTSRYSHAKLRRGSRHNYSRPWRASRASWRRRSRHPSQKLHIWDPGHQVRRATLLRLNADKWM